MILGLTRSDAGVATINGRRYHDLSRPLCELGALIDSGGVNPSRTAVEHLRWLAAANDIRRSRADEVLAIVGLDSAAGRKVGGFSLGMRQRLGIAAALIGDPPVLILDEPMNGLDPEGIRWIRGFMQGLAADGRTVLVASHLMSEMALTASALIVIGAGRLIAAESVTDFVERAVSSVRVRSRNSTGWKRHSPSRVSRCGATAMLLRSSVSASSRSGRWRLESARRCSSSAPQRASLEEAFMQLTCDTAEFATRRQAS